MVLMLAAVIPAILLLSSPRPSDAFSAAGRSPGKAVLRRAGIALGSQPGDGGGGDGGGGDGGDGRLDRLASLGYSEDEIRRSRRPSEAEREDPGPVEVFEVNVDPVTLTAVGFGLIALNFFVFANLGDGGIGGIVASFINASRY